MSNAARTIKAFLEPKGYAQITTLTAAAGLGTIPDFAKLVLIQPETKDVRWRDDGTDPTSTVGMVLAAGETLEYTGDMSAIKLIETAASAKVNLTFYG